VSAKLFPMGRAAARAAMLLAAVAASVAGGCRQKRGVLTPPGVAVDNALQGQRFAEGFRKLGRAHLRSTVHLVAGLDGGATDNVTTDSDIWMDDQGNWRLVDLNDKDGGREIVLHGHELAIALRYGRMIRRPAEDPEPLRLLVVSGSNMSGKSTLLRTIGVNTVLALAGAPVRARRLKLSQMALGASIRTTDSLEEGHSRFMAEILRLKQVLELAPPSMFLLDELLGGTNSHDRAVGSEGLIRALLARGAVGLVTTHDLSLARVADELAPAAANVHFEDRLVDGRLVFDYKMRPGVVERSNALDLMRAVGLDV